LVEFGLTVAAVGFVALLGFNALSGAQQWYWGAAAPQPQQAPGGSFQHKTTTTGTCASPLTAGVPGSLSCMITVTDVVQPPQIPVAPVGNITVLKDGAPFGSPCPLAVVAGQPQRICTFNQAWSPAAEDVGTHLVTAQYSPTPADSDIHQASSLGPVQVIVQPVANLAFTIPTSGLGPPPPAACWNALNVFNGRPGEVEIGHPEICHLSLTDGAGNGIPNVQIEIESLSNGAGIPFFNCFTNNRKWANCSPNSPKIRITTGAGAPNGPPKGEAWFIYRRYYSYQQWLTGTVSDVLSATVIGIPGVGPVTTPLTIAPPVIPPHPTTVLVGCPSHSTGTKASWQVPSTGLFVQSETQLQGSLLDQPFTCTVVVLDDDYNNAYTGADIDPEDMYPPTGTVTFVDRANGSVLLDQNNNPATCSPSAGIALGTPYIGSVLPGIPEPASSCTVTFKPSNLAGITMQAEYGGEPVAALTQGHSAGASPNIANLFN
jgi:hypothetical protein